MKRVVLIVNTVSGKMKMRDELYPVVEALLECNVVPTVMFTKAKKHAVDLAMMAAAAYGRGEIDAVICCGGDGTFNETVTGVLSAKSRIPIGYIPTGTTNDFAVGLGLQTEPATAASSIARALRRGVTKELDIGAFGEDRYFTYIASFGAFATPSYATPQEVKNAIGHVAYIFEGIRDFFAIKPIPVVCTACDGRRYMEDFIVGAVSNALSLGGVFKLNSNDVDMSDGMFEVLLIRPPKTALDMNLITTAILSTNLKDNPMIEFFRADSLHFELPDGTGFTLDGEQANGGGSTDIRILGGAVRLLTIE